MSHSFRGESQYVSRRTQMLLHKNIGVPFFARAALHAPEVCALSEDGIGTRSGERFDLRPRAELTAEILTNAEIVGEAVVERIRDQIAATVRESLGERFMRGVEEIGEAVMEAEAKEASREARREARRAELRASMRATKRKAQGK